MKGEFVTITLVDDNRTISKYLWLKNFSGVNDLDLLQKSKGKKVTVEFEISEYYDPRIKDYRNFNVISSLKMEKD